MVEVPEYRPGRNFIRPGDTVKCSPLVGVSFRAVVTRILQREGTGEVEIEVVGGPVSVRGERKAIRTFTPDRISRVAQSRVEERKS
jgi:hypothetical protein